MSKERATMQQVRRNRWERQRTEAIKREQIERCYKQHQPQQVLKHTTPDEVFNENCAKCGYIIMIGSACVHCAKVAQ